ncbi:MAG: hypothetical protein ACTMUB_10100 [cyanobacterium endosymbiont of Rhopalodia musculus]|uniref:hypothetical protein n=1 Tax=cyanobacterium endosymbiont of Epithemia clementina EcSB TaxID=3034674 RepID=UPI002481448B|nr:hypothetical protein [cyanobacterium endosymbiont of Epithemia clementina EcSB]WGT68550.1 hypothetical protein P3F56_04885 [cyanobacterium endosymbiont of Epithemia clementina EcSB]
MSKQTLSLLPSPTFSPSFHASAPSVISDHWFEYNSWIDYMVDQFGLSSLYSILFYSTFIR